MSTLHFLLIFRHIYFHARGPSNICMIWYYKSTVSMDDIPAVQFRSFQALFLVNAGSLLGFFWDLDTITKVHWRHCRDNPRCCSKAACSCVMVAMYQAFRCLGEKNLAGAPHLTWYYFVCHHTQRCRINKKNEAKVRASSLPFSYLFLGLWCQWHLLHTHRLGYIRDVHLAQIFITL